MQKQIAANKRNTYLLMIGFVLLVGLIGALIAYLLDDWGVIVYVLILSAGYAAFQYFFATKLTIAMTGARETNAQENPRLYHIVEELADAAKVPMPKVYIVNDSAPNAFATGRDPSHSIVAATTGLLDILDNTELRAVMAHEMSHIKNYDIRVSMITFGLSSLVGFIADVGVRMLFYGNRRRNEERSPVGALIVLIASILAPIAAMLVQMAVSREREYLADASSVNLTHSPDAMISALKKLSAHSRPMRCQNSATESMYINNPLRKGFLSNLFNTHPPIEKRIERLEHGKN